MGLRVPLSIRVGASIFALIVLVVGFMLAYFPAKQVDAVMTGLRSEAKSLSTLTAFHVRLGLEFEDIVTMRQVLVALAENRNFSGGAVFDDKGKKVVEHGVHGVDSKWLERASPEANNQTRVFEIAGQIVSIIPIESNERYLGALVTSFSTEVVEERRRDIQGTTVWAAVWILLAGIVAAYLVGAWIGRRISRVSDTALKVAAGNLDQASIRDRANDEVGDLVRGFNALLLSLRTITKQVERVADGDLSCAVDVKGDLATALNQMIRNQAKLVEQISSTASQLNSAATQFLANAREQQRGATEQSVAVDEIRRTMGSLLDSGKEIGKVADDVLQNAEHSQTNCQSVSEKISVLAAHNQRIGEILEVIKEIANKSDILALNAALEGTKAGEAGRGFSLVASQMQRLAENVMGSVMGIRELTATVTESTQEAVLATEESTKLAESTTSSSRQIGFIINQQQSGTKQATVAMNDVAKIASQTASGSKEIVESASDLLALSERLQQLVGTFRVKSAMIAETENVEGA